MTEPTVEEAKALLAEAETAKQAVDKARDQALDEVRRVHDPLVRIATEHVGRARRALAEARSREAQGHEWEGRKVYRVKIVHVGSLWHGHKREERVEGIVFTYRHTDDLGPGHTYNRPQIGDPWVRLLKKDGTPSRKTARFLTSGGAVDGWKLAEESA